MFVNGHMELDFLPLKSYANIVEANALRIDWNTVIPKEKLNYIMGNPPFVGFSMMNKGQKEDVDMIFFLSLNTLVCVFSKTKNFFTGPQLSKSGN